MVCHENRLVYLGKKLGKRHPLVRFMLSRIYRIYAWFDSIFFLSKVAIYKKLFSDSERLMVNVGGGRWYKRNWKVLDFQCSWYSWNKIFIDFDYDLTKRDKMPFENDSVDFFYSEHTFEHISDEDCEHAITEMYRCLRTGSAVRIVVPNMDLIYEKYKEGDEQFFELWIEAHKATLTQALMTIFAFPRKDEGDESIREKFLTMKKTDFFNYYTENLRQNPDYAGHHINWFTSSKLEKMLKDAGFQTAYKTRHRGSRFKELRGRGLDRRPSWSLYIEAVK